MICKITIINVHNGNCVKSFVMNVVQAKELLNKMNKYRKLSPKGYNRNKSKRKNFFGIDEVFKRLTSDDFYYSDYTGKYYEYLISMEL